MLFRDEEINKMKVAYIVIFETSIERKINPIYKRNPQR